MRSGLADLRDGGSGPLHQQAGGNRPGSAQAALAMDQDLAAVAQQGAEPMACVGPVVFELGVGHAAVIHRQVIPVEPALFDLPPELRDLEGVELGRRDHADYGGGAPIA